MRVRAGAEPFPATDTPIWQNAQDRRCARAGARPLPRRPPFPAEWLGRDRSTSLTRRLFTEERRDFLVRLELGQLLSRGEVRLVAHCIDHAQNPERLVRARAELMPCQWRDGNEVAQLDCPYFLAYEAVPVTAQDKHGMHVFVPLQRGVTTRLDFEITKLSVQLRIREQHLAGDRLEERAIILLVGKRIHAFPPVRICFAMQQHYWSQPASAT